MNTTAEVNKELRRAVILVGVLNLAYFFVEAYFASASRSVSLFADSVDFLEDAALNSLILVGFLLNAKNRARLGVILAGIILVPCLLTLWTIIHRLLTPSVPDAGTLTTIGLGALCVNLFCALVLARVRHLPGSLVKAAFLSARNDALANVAIIVAGLAAIPLHSGIPDLLVGIGIMVLNADAAFKVFKTAQGELNSELEVAP